MTVVVTGFSPSGYLQYGKRFLDTFNQFWPQDIDLYYYVEEPVKAPRGHCMHLMVCAGAMEFIERHKDNPAYCGRAPAPHWKEKDRLDGYSYKYDALKFFRQLMIPQHASSFLKDDEILVWCDGDIVTFADLPSGFIEGLLGDSDLCFLGRGPKHSEIGFWAVRLNPSTRRFVGHMDAMYATDEVFKLQEWHSAHVFDHCRREFEERGGRSRDLTPGGKGHVFMSSPLASFCDHLKGTSRKLAGHSSQRPKHTR